MFRLGMGAYANRRNNDLSFVNSGISAPMKSVQPQWSYYHEALRRLRLYNLYYPSGGVLEDH
jgi:hypothetical protein